MLTLRQNRRWHRWFAWTTAIFVLLWTVTGIIMALPPGPTGAAFAEMTVPADALSPAAAVRAAGLDETTRVRGLALRVVDDQLTWALSLRGSTRLIDARTGQPFVIDSDRAARLARRGLGDDWVSGGITRLAESDGTWDGAFPVWRVEFADRGYRAYIAPDGSVSFEGRGKAIKGLAGQLHQFSVGPLLRGRQPLRRWLLWTVSAATLVLLVTGIVLLLPVRKRSSS
ncbi:MAG: hypothetical protein ACT4OZ_02325 [Gemmatimonadota bacterium]